MDSDLVKYGLMILLICVGVALIIFAKEVAPGIADALTYEEG